jgi:hypothetical protein
MDKCGLSGRVLPFSIVVSAFGFFTIPLLALYGAQSTEAFMWRKPVIGSVFALICLLGILGSLSPKKCSETFGHQRRMDTASSHLRNSELAISSKGHHYDCGKFSTHTIQVKGHILCAACTGLFLGGTGALLGTILYFFAGWELAQIRFLSVAIGVAAMTFGFLQLKFGGFARLVLNVLFVLGAFLILAGLDGFAESLLVDFFSIVLIAFWIFTRILLSEWDHWKICRGCSIHCEINAERKVGSISSTQT